MDFRELEALYSELLEDDETTKKEINKKKNELEEAKEKHEKKNNELDNLKDESASLKKEILELEYKIEKDEKEVDTIDKKISSKPVQLTAAELEQITDKKLEDIKIALDNHNNGLEIIRKNLKDIHLERESLSKKKKEIDNKINSKTTRLTNDESNEIEGIKEKDKKLQDINGDLDKQIKDNKSIPKRLEKLESDKKELSDNKKNVAQKIEDISESFKLIKIKINEKKNELISKILQERTIIATTNTMVCKKELSDINFDIVIMDEAGAIDLLGAVIPLLRAEKIVFLGDHKQLPPITGNAREVRDFLEKHQELEKSIFEKFRDRCSDEKDENKMVMLKKQYRMRKEISKFVSDNFYDGELEYVEPDKSKVKYTLKENDDPILDIRCPMLCLPWSYRSKPIKGISGKSYVCKGERMVIQKIIKNFKDTYRKEKDITDNIAIITPYNAQKNKINKEIPEVECGTVHTFQGQEKEVIIYSTVTSGGYLLDPNKSKKAMNLLNVAVSRAKEKFIIIGDLKLFSNVELYNKLYGHIKELGGVKSKKDLKEYDIKIKNFCKLCNEEILDKPDHDYCRACWSIHRIKTFIEDKPRTFKAKDGDLLRSSYEARIDDWFCDNGIWHEVEQQLPFTDLYCDWFIPKKDKFTHDIYVEYWGLMGKKWYEEGRNAKEKLYKKHKLTLLNIEPEDMKALGDVLERKLRKYRIQ